MVIHKQTYSQPLKVTSKLLLVNPLSIRHLKLISKLLFSRFTEAEISQEHILFKLLVSDLNSRMIYALFQNSFGAIKQGSKPSKLYFVVFIKIKAWNLKYYLFQNRCVRHQIQTHFDNLSLATKCSFLNNYNAFYI